MTVRRGLPIPLPGVGDEPLVSVVIANYNYGHVIRECVASVLAQSWSRLELVVCDDGSTDDSLRVLEDLKRSDSRIQVIAQPNGGHAAALNTAYAAARGDVIALLDADDTWAPKKIERTLDAFRADPSAGMAVHPVRVEYVGGGILKDRHPRHPDTGWLLPKLASGGLLIVPPCSGVSLRREVASRVFPLPPGFQALADRVVVERAAALTHVTACGPVLGTWRQHGKNVTGFKLPTTSAGVTRLYDQIVGTMAATREFVADVHGIEVRARDQRRNQLGELELARRVISGADITRADVTEVVGDPTRRRHWAVLVSVPRPLRLPLLRWWYGGDIAKRWLRGAGIAHPQW